jgi:serine/threonine protein kinase
MKRMVEHGFLDMEINENLANICEVIPRAREIARLGKEQIINSDTWRFLDRTLDKEGVYVGWHIGELYREGTYGKIHKAHRMVVTRRTDGLFDVATAPHEVVVKQTVPPPGSSVLPAEDVTAHTSEALLHVLAWQAMQKTATPWAIPRPYEVFGDHSDALPGWKSMSLCMSYVHGRTLYSYMQKHWKLHTQAENTRSYLEILALVSYVLYHLQQTLRLNHRDVKVNNILVRRRPAGDPPILLELGGKIIGTHFEVTLIDFGFACVGCPPPKLPMTAFQAGSWFPFGELCCKEGRDIAQLIYCIHCYFPMEDYVLPAVSEAVRSWMQIPWSGGVADALHGFTKEGRPRRNGAKGHATYDTGIYEFLRRADVDPATCGPVAIFRAIYDLKHAHLTHE